MRTPVCNFNPKRRSSQYALVHVVNTAFRLGRTLDFDPVKEEVIGDAEANRLVRDADRGYRKGE